VKEQEISGSGEQRRQVGAGEGERVGKRGEMNTVSERWDENGRKRRFRWAAKRLQCDCGCDAVRCTPSPVEVEVQVGRPGRLYLWSCRVVLCLLLLKRQHEATVRTERASERATLGDGLASRRGERALGKGTASRQGSEPLACELPNCATVQRMEYIYMSTAKMVKDE